MGSPQVVHKMPRFDAQILHSAANLRARMEDNRTTDVFLLCTDRSPEVA